MNRPASCARVQSRLAGYLDGALGGRERAGIERHLAECTRCRVELEEYHKLARYLAAVQPVAAPADLALRIRVETSRLRAAQEGGAARLWSRAGLVFENILRPIAVPATGGLLTAILVFVFVTQGLVVGIPFGVVPDDLPLGLVQSARVESLAPFPVPGLVAENGQAEVGELVLEATLDAEGEVVSYRILSGPDGAAVRRQIDQVLLFSRFRPQLSFGRPMSGGRVILSFSEVRVRG